MAARRFSQAISEGDGISVLVEVHEVEDARAAAADGAEAIVVRQAIDALRDSTELPVLWRAEGAPADAARAGADACLVVVEEFGDNGDRLETTYRTALDLGLDCVVEVHDDEELELALDRLDPEIFLLGVPRDADTEALEGALDLLPDVPAGKLAVADVPVVTREQVVQLERAGVDAVIVGVRNVAELVGEAPPEV
jgi:indole-3-glycerol phosphate synthase